MIKTKKTTMNHYFLSSKEIRYNTTTVNPKSNFQYPKIPAILYAFTYLYGFIIPLGSKSPLILLIIPSSVSPLE